MTSDRRDKGSQRIPIRFTDADDEVASAREDVKRADAPIEDEDLEPETYDSSDTADLLPGTDIEPEERTGGPDTAELIATRSELKRIEGENTELKDRLARRQADFENYRKRVERERTETYNRVVADVTTKLLPVVDNLKRALEAEASVEASESDEFRHFLSGVDLISKQL